MSNSEKSEDEAKYEQSRLANYGKYRELKLKPSDNFIKDLDDDKSSSSSSGKTNISLSMQQIERNSNVYSGALKGVVAGTPKIETEVDYQPAKRKVSSRASSLKLYAITLLILSFVGLLNTFVLLSLYHISGYSGSLRTEYIYVNSVGVALYILPVISSVLLLSIKSIALVKVILLINIADALLVILQSLSAVYVVQLGGSFTVLPAIIVELAIGAWAWSVLAEVKGLMGVSR
jgi:hypothetical protein